MLQSRSAFCYTVEVVMVVSLMFLFGSFLVEVIYVLILCRLLYVWVICICIWKLAQYFAHDVQSSLILINFSDLHYFNSSKQSAYQTHLNNGHLCLFTWLITACLSGGKHRSLLTVDVSLFQETRTQIHWYCLKIYPKICHKIILRQKLWCRKIILWHILG